MLVSFQMDSDDSCLSFRQFHRGERRIDTLSNPGRFGMFLNAIVLGEQIPQHCFSYWAA